MYIIINLLLYMYINRVKIAHKEKVFFIQKDKKKKKTKNIYVDIHSCRNYYQDDILGKK